jgi:hypothetical protein
MSAVVKPPIIQWKWIGCFGVGCQRALLDPLELLAVAPLELLAVAPLELLVAPPVPSVVAPWVALDEPQAMSHAAARAKGAMSGERGDGA